jgi:hypothetical protein
MLRSYPARVRRVAGRVSEGVSVFVWATRDAESVSGGREVHTVQGTAPRRPLTLTRAAHANRTTPAEHAHATAHGVREPSPIQCHNLAQWMFFFEPFGVLGSRSSYQILQVDQGGEHSVKDAGYQNDGGGA